MVEEETLLPVDDDIEEEEDGLSAQEIAEQEYGELCICAEGRRSLTAVEQQPCADLLPLSPTLLSFVIKNINTRGKGEGEEEEGKEAENTLLPTPPRGKNNRERGDVRRVANLRARVTVTYRTQDEVAGLISRGRCAFNLSGGPGDDKAREGEEEEDCLLYTSPSPRDATLSRMPSSA